MYIRGRASLVKGTPRTFQIISYPVGEREKSGRELESEQGREKKEMTASEIEE
jgi:hypothetical protein